MSFFESFLSQVMLLILLTVIALSLTGCGSKAPQPVYIQNLTEYCKPSGCREA